MRVCTVELATGGKYGGNDPRPNPQIRQPAEGSPCRKDKIERARREVWRLLHPPLNEVGLQTGLLGKPTRKGQRGTGEIKARDHGTASCEAKCVSPDMTLQMQRALSGDIADFRCFNRVERVLASPKTIKHIASGGVARVNGGTLIPEPAVDIDRIGHAKPHKPPTPTRRASIISARRA
jgi:hypothetical protein